MKIEIKLPADRTKLGRLTLIDDGGFVVLGPVDCLGKSDEEYATLEGNPTRDPIRRGGDTPLGFWSTYIERFHPPVGETTNHSYGPYGKIHLTATGGQAASAQNINGRSGICIHSGPLNPDYVRTNGLRPTHGCVRVMDAAMLDLIGEMTAHDGPVTCATLLMTE